MLTGTDSSATYDSVHPLYPGVTIVVGHQNTIVEEFSAGKALLYADANGTLLPEDQQMDMHNNSIYDLASLTKLFTTVLALDQIGTVRPSPREEISRLTPQRAPSVLTRLSPPTSLASPPMARRTSPSSR